MPRKGRFRLAAAIVEEVVGVPNAVAFEIIGDAVVLVAARLGDDVEHAARRASELRVVAVGLHFEFLHGVDRRIDDSPVDVAGGVGRAVDEYLLRARSSAGDIEVGLEEVASNVVAASVAEVRSEGAAGGQADESDGVANI